MTAKRTKKMTIKFNKHNIVDNKSGLKVRVFYSLNCDKDGNPLISISQKDCDRNLLKIFSNAKNNSDGREDYFENSHLKIYPGDEYYNDAYIQAKAWDNHFTALQAKKDAEYKSKRAA